MEKPGFYCSDYAQRVDEPLAGTAPHAPVWFLLEYNGRWEPKAFENSELPEPVKSFLSNAADQIPGTRIQVIRQQPRQAPPGIAFYVALVREANPVLYQFYVDSYEDLCALDLAALTAGDPTFDAHRRTAPLVLVCTHGRRDKCCARYGLPVYETLRAQFGGVVWQTSHVGGHRFAANVACFPHGYLYGRVDPLHAVMLVQGYRHGYLTLDVLRGRTCYSEPVQAAEYFLRRAQVVTGLDAFRLEQVEPLNEQEWLITARLDDDSTRYRVHIAAESDFETWTSCRDTAPSTTTSYHLVASETVD